MVGWTLHQQVTGFRECLLNAGGEVWSVVSMFSVVAMVSRQAAKASSTGSTCITAITFILNTVAATR